MRKELKHAKVSCGGTYEVNYNDKDLPYLVCNNCGHEIKDWIKWDEEYKEYWKEEDKWKSKKDQVACLLGYFVYLYEEYYGIPFTFSLSEKGLFRGVEAFHIRKLIGMFNSNAIEAKTYIKWLFDTKVKIRKKRITSLGFLANAGVIQEYKLKKAKSNRIERSTKLPENMVKWISHFAPGLLDVISLNDFGELNLLLTYYKEGHFKDNEDVEKFINKLAKTKYVDQELNIKWSN